MEKIMSILNRCDPATRDHQLRVATLAGNIAAKMGYSAKMIENVRLAGLVHDIGKIFLPPEFAVNSDELTVEELILIRQHPRAGFDMLDGFGLPETVRLSVLEHHEHVDGSGYPNKLFGEQIQIEARIVSVADVIDAMTSDRPYNKALKLSDAVNEISHNKGRFYDLTVVNVYLSITSGAMC